MPESPQGVLLTVAYQGGPFHGFAPQPGVRTVAAELLDAVRSIDPRVSGLRAASRTDAGVHARGQLVAIDTDRPIGPRGWVLGLSSRLPPEISVRSAVFAPAGFDPRRHAVLKHYRYTLLLDHCRDTFLEPYAWRVRPEIDLALGSDEARAVVGTHDFGAFRSAADRRPSTVRTLADVSVTRAGHDPRQVWIDIRGDAFLHNMVRILVGTIVDIARGVAAPGAFARALESRSRSDLGMTSPAHGLCLESIEIDTALDGDSVWPMVAGVRPHRAT